MAKVCPTITVSDAHAYRQQMERIVPFTKRVHIDLMDGIFAPTKSVEPSEVWWPAGMEADIHLMFKNPSHYIYLLIDLKPQLIIIHAETEDDFIEIAERIKRAKIKVGVALLQQTPVSKIEPALSVIDHVLIFSGNLGYQGGGTVDLELLTKVKSLRKLKDNLEIGWDGGVTEHNIGDLAEGDVDVLNVGSYIQRAENANSAYAKLVKLVTTAGKQ